VRIVVIVIVVIGNSNGNVNDGESGTRVNELDRADGTRCGTRQRHRPIGLHSAVVGISAEIFE